MKQQPSSQGATGLLAQRPEIPHSPEPTWRTKLVHWAYGLRPADSIFKRRAVDLVAKLEFDRHLVDQGLYVDIGSGTGHNCVRMARLAKRCDGRLLGVEPVSRPTPRVWRSIRKWGIERIQFVRSIGNRLPLADGQVDGVSLFFVLHHIPSDIQFHVLDEVKRILKPGGLVFIWEDTPENDREFISNEIWDRRLNFEARSEPHYYRSGDQWQTLLAKQGFGIEQRVYYEDHSRRKKEGVIRHTGFVLRAPEQAGANNSISP